MVNVNICYLFSASNQIATISGLMPGTNYSVFVRAINREPTGEEFVGQPSNETSFKTLPDGELNSYFISHKC